MDTLHMAPDEGHPDGRPDDGTQALDGDPGDQSNGSQFEKRYNDLRSLTDRVGTENATLKRELAEMRGQMSVLLAQRTKDEQPEVDDVFKSWGTDQFKEEVDAEPSKMATYVKDALGKLVGAIQERDRLYEAALRELQGDVVGRFEKLDPAYQEHSEKIAELRRDSDFAGMSDKQLLKIIRVQNGEQVVEAPPSGPSGRSPRSGSSVKITKETAPSAWKLALQMSNDDEKMAEKVFARMASRMGGK